LKPPLLAFFNRFLSRNHQDRHGPQLRIGCGRYKIGGTGSQRGQAHSHLTRQAAIGCGHESRTLFVSGQDELNAGFPQRFQKIQILLAGDTEDVFHAFIFQRAYK